MDNFRITSLNCYPDLIRNINAFLTVNSATSAIARKTDLKRVRSPMILLFPSETPKSQQNIPQSTGKLSTRHKHRKHHQTQTSTTTPDTNTANNTTGYKHQQQHRAQTPTTPSGTNTNNITGQKHQQQHRAQTSTRQKRIR